MNPPMDPPRSDILMDLSGESLIGASAAGPTQVESDCLPTAEELKSILVERSPRNATDPAPSQLVAVRLTD